MSIFTSNIPLIVNNISTMKDVSAQNMDLSGSLDVSGNTTIGGTLDVETSLTTNQLIVNDSLLFDTIVLRRPNEVTTTNNSVSNPGSINIRELQCWVNEVNILATNAGSLNSYFAYWSDKENDIGYRSTFSPELAYNDIINSSTDFAIGPENCATDFAFIIKNVPKSSITAIQSFIYYNRDSNTWGQRAIGLAIELYNTNNDPNLETPLATTNEITTAEEVYRYDFPAIDTYPSGDFSDTDSTTNIASETLALKEVVSEFADSANITGGLKVDTITTTGNVDISGNASITGDLVIGTTNIITELGTKQDEINDGDLTIAKTDGLQTALNGKQDTIEDGDLTIANTNGLQTTLDNKYDDTGGTIDGNVTINGDLVVGTTNVITEIGTKQDEINDGDLTIANTNGLQTALDNKYDDTGGTISGSVTITSDLVVGTTNIITELGTKQDEITTDTDLTLNSITTEDLIVNNLNVDNVITYEANEFNTIVIRRFDESTSPDINLSEFQIWVNNENIIYENRGLLNGYFANWSNKDTPLPPDTLVGFTNSVNPYLFNNVIEGSIGASGSSPINAVIIKTYL